MEKFKAIEIKIIKKTVFLEYNHLYGITIKNLITASLVDFFYSLKIL